jgi:hypothetical protein
MQKFERMPYNDTCVETLEKLLKQAKEGRINFFAFSICEGPMHGYDGFVGEMASFYTGYYGLHRCAKRIMAKLEDLQQEERTTDGPPDLYTYDVGLEPISHDFIPWLVTIKMLQAQEQAVSQQSPTKTKICFLKKKGTSYVDEAYRAGFFDSVMVPALELFDIERSPEAKKGRHVDNYTYREIVELSKAGYQVPRITVPPKLLSYMQSHLQWRNPVTITLREHLYWEHRNSSMTDWLRFAEYLQARGEHVIFVRDYARADEDITGFDTMPDASKNFQIRAALYECAKCNLFVSNGPATLGVFGSRPWLQFIDMQVEEQYQQNRPDWWWLHHGLSKGEQFPWSEPNQRIVWAPDTYEAMVKAWEETFPLAMEAAE